MKPLLARQQQRGADVVATDSSQALSALTLAALALPGLIMQPAAAAESAPMGVIYEHYEEGERDLNGLTSLFQPIQVDTLLARAPFSLSNTVTATVSFTQDTWSGATPVATAPASAQGNRLAAPAHAHVITGASIDASGHLHQAEASENTPEPGVSARTGASPYLYSTLKLDAKQQPLKTNSQGQVVGGVDTQLVHTLSSASPEVRQQFDFNFRRDFRMAAAEMGAGLSQERDFESRFGHVSGSWDCNRRLTTLSAGLNYAHNRTHALLDHDVVPHVYEPYRLIYQQREDNGSNRAFSSSTLEAGRYAPTLKGQRDDWGLDLGVSHILNKTALLAASLSFTHSLGYQANPYKAVQVAFIDPLKQQGQAGGNTGANYTYDAELVALLEQRPDVRNQGALNLKYTQYIAATDAALHLGYRYFQDTWGIQSHSLNTEWVQPLGKTWTLSPYVRYYSQTQAHFYTPYLVTHQGLYSRVSAPVQGTLYEHTRTTTSQVNAFVDPTGSIPPATNSPPTENAKPAVNALKPDTAPFNRALLPADYSSDARLSAFGTLSAGITLTKTLRKGLNVDFSYAQMRHAGGLKLGGGGEGRYADFDSYWFNIGLNMDLTGRLQQPSNRQLNHSPPNHPHTHASRLPAPAGVQWGHLLDKKGDSMLGYRLMNNRLGGDIHPNGKASDYALINQACYGQPCYVRPKHMRMRMQMLDIMYAPTDRLTLMLMPQFVDMNMGMRLLAESPRTGGMDNIGMAIMHAEHRHTTSGLGDTEFHGLINLFKGTHAQLHLGLGLSAPTANVGAKMRPMMGNDLGFLEYGMQLGSGTWDFKPSLTLSGQTAAIGWGAQISGTQRLEKQNASGYALGESVQSSVWGSYALTGTFSASLRGLYSEQAAIKGAYNNTHTPISLGDYPQNYGGRFVDAGLGVAATLDSGRLAGTRWGLEWLQPVSDRPNGYQLARKGTLIVTWGMHL